MGPECHQIAPVLLSPPRSGPSPRRRSPSRSAAARAAGFRVRPRPCLKPRLAAQRLGHGAGRQFAGQADVGQVDGMDGMQRRAGREPHRGARRRGAGGRQPVAQNDRGIGLTVGFVAMIAGTRDWRRDPSSVVDRRPSNQARGRWRPKTIRLAPIRCASVGSPLPRGRNRGQAGPCRRAGPGQCRLQHACRLR